MAAAAVEHSHQAGWSQTLELWNVAHPRCQTPTCGIFKQSCLLIEFLLPVRFILADLQYQEVTLTRRLAAAVGGGRRFLTRKKLPKCCLFKTFTAS